MKTRKGSALLLALLMITSLILFVLNISKFGLVNMQIGDRVNDSQRAIYAAKTGIEIYLSKKYDFLEGHNLTINPKDLTICTIENKKDECVTVSSVTEINSYVQPRLTNTSLINNHALEIHAGLLEIEGVPCFNGSIFNNINKILDSSGNLSNRVKSVYNKQIRFVSPSLKVNGYTPTEGCADWQVKLGNDLFNYDLIYINNEPNQELDLKRYFSPVSSGGINDINLTQYVAFGGHLYIENSTNAKILFPSSEEMKEWYGEDFVIENRLDKLAVQWSEDNSDFYNPADSVSYPNYLNQSSIDIYNTSKNIFKYLFDYANDEGISVEKTSAYLQDATHRTCSIGSCGYASGFPYILPERPPGHRGRVDELNGYTELINYSQDRHVNMAIRYFGDGPWGWIMVSSSAPAGIIASPGSVSPTEYHTNVDQDDLDIAPSVLFFLGLGEYAQKIQTVKVVGTYGGNKKTYQLSSYLTNEFLGITPAPDFDFVLSPYPTKRFKEVIE